MAAVPLRRCYELICDNTDKVQFIEFTEQEKAPMIERQLYSYSFLSKGGNVLQKRRCNEIAKNADVFAIRRPVDEFRLDELVNLIEAGPCQ